MDPNATLSELANAIQNDRWQEAAELADALQRWLDNGGFAPTLTGRPTFDRILIKSTLEAIHSWEI